MTSSPGNSDGLAFRPETSDDEDLLRALYSSTRAQEMVLARWDDAQKASFLRQQFDAQRAYYRRQYPDASYDVFTLDHAPIGRLYLDRGAEFWLLLDIVLLPEHRNRGIGTRLMRRLLDEAAAAARPVHLHVETFSLARPFYDRLGFEEINLTGFHYLMIWTPPAP